MIHLPRASSRLLTLLSLLVLIAPMLAVTACQSPSDGDEDPPKVDEIVDGTANPDPANATESTDGRTYRITKNDKTEDVPYKWKTRVDLSATFNNNATKDNAKIEFPVQVTSVVVKAVQASGGIPSPPTNGELEQSDAVLSNPGSNTIGGINQPLNLGVEVWYDFPNKRKEALITATINFRDDSSTPKTFAKEIKVRVNP